MTERVCEVCGAEPQEPRSGKLVRVLIEERIVALCESHRKRLERAKVNTLGELFALFPEPEGRRAKLGRRSPLDRRVFPPRPEGRRQVGRRRGDEP